MAACCLPVGRIDRFLVLATFGRVFGRRDVGRRTGRLSFGGGGAGLRARTLRFFGVATRVTCLGLRGRRIRVSIFLAVARFFGRCVARFTLRTGFLGKRFAALLGLTGFLGKRLGLTVLRFFDGRAVVFLTDFLTVFVAAFFAFDARCVKVTRFLTGGRTARARGRTMRFLRFFFGRGCRRDATGYPKTGS